MTSERALEILLSCTYFYNGNREEVIKAREKIVKDIEILEILKKNMRVETEYFDDDGTSKEYEFITFYEMELWENNEKEYNKIKEWLKEK